MELQSIKILEKWPCVTVSSHISMFFWYNLYSVLNSWGQIAIYFWQKLTLCIASINFTWHKHLSGMMCCKLVILNGHNSDTMLPCGSNLTLSQPILGQTAKPKACFLSLGGLSVWKYHMNSFSVVKPSQ